MCFSAPASFTAAALLLPVGSLAVRSVCSPGSAAGDDPLPLAVTPLLFGLQQGIEGLVWLGIEGRLASAPTEWASLAYLFFAYAFWPVWIPWAARRFGARRADGAADRLLRLLPWFGLMAGVLLWLPLALPGHSAVPAVAAGSLDYPTPLVFGPAWQNDLGSILYATTICLPLLLTASRSLTLFAVGLVIAFALAQLFWDQALSSVWCYFCGLLSLALLQVVRRPLADDSPAADRA